MAQRHGHIIGNKIGVAYVLLSLLTFLSLHLVYVECLCAADESRALLALKGTSESTAALSSWEEGSDCCQGWAGVTCDASGTHVSALNLTGRFQLQRVTIPKEVCELRSLQVFNISVEQRWSDGDIPDCLWNMAELKFLIISAAMITEMTSSSSSIGRTASITVQGSLPAQVCNLQHLTHLDVGGLSFENSIVPDCLWHMGQLQHLTLGGKQLSSQVCKLRHLTHLDASADFQMRQQIPSCIWSMTRLEFLSLVGFDEASPISSDVCNIKNLAFIDLTESKLYGNFPSCLWNLTKLEHLSWGSLATRYPLQVSLSSDICNLKSLSYLSVRVDAARGYIPACLWNLTHLEVLQMLPQRSWKEPEQSLHSRASLSSQLCSLSKLRRLALPYSDIIGILPACIWNLTNLEFLDLSGADLSTAEYPTDVSAPSLTHLFLESTNVDTGLLNAVGKFAALSELRISGNNIISLPEGIRNLSALETLSARSNLITRVPAWISNCSRLRSLELSNNRISDIPTSLGNSSSLDFIDLSSNLLREVALSRSGPSSIGLFLSQNKIERISLTGFSGLYLLDLSGNLLSDIGTDLDMENSGLTSLWLANNRISRIPAMTLNLSTLSDLDFSDNPLKDISGLCNLRGIQRLSLSRSSIGTLGKGVVPSCFKSFIKLSDIDLSSNQISGDLSAFMSSSIPNVTQLTSLDLSNNDLSGDLSSFSVSPLKFYRLDLSRNQLTRELPSTLLSSTPGPYASSSLDVSGNRLSGRVPEPHGEDWDLNLSGNDFEGPLPSFSMCTFSRLVLSRNNFTGVIPSELRGGSGGLFTLDLSHNNLEGTVPLTLKNLSGSLRDFSVASNRLSGPFPRWIVGGDFKSLEVLDLSNNSFSGSVLAEYFKLSGFTSGDEFEPR